MDQTNTNTTTTSMDRYAQIQAFVQKDARDIATEVYNKLGSQYDVNTIPIHIHDGVSSARINQHDIIPNVKYNTFLVQDTTETFTIKNIPNITRIDFLGFAANNKTAPATLRATCNGVAQFGQCFGFSGTGSTITLDTSKVGIPFIQASNAMYIDSTTLANQRVSASNEHLVIISDSGGSTVVQMDIISYTNASIIISVTLAANWKLQGTLILT